MKKALSLLFAAALALSLSVGVFAASANITKNGSVIVSSATPEQPKGNLIDGDGATYWQATTTTNEYLGFSWSDKMNIDKLIVQWGGGRPEEANITVEVSDDLVVWTKANFRLVREDVDDTHHTDTITLTGAQGKAVRVFESEMGNTKDSLQCWEIEAFGSTASGDPLPPAPKTGTASLMPYVLMLAAAAAAVALTAKKVRA